MRQSGPIAVRFAGDFVDLGTYNAGTLIDFFLVANGANGGTNTYTADSASNPDGIQHVVSYALPGSPYLIIGFEDLFGGDEVFIVVSLEDAVFEFDVEHFEGSGVFEEVDDDV